MQKCIDAAAPAQRTQLTMRIAVHTQIFVKDPFANYVIQYILDLHIPEVSVVVGEHLLGSLLALSREKFSSNVIEKCLEMTSARIRAKMVAEIMQAQCFYDFLID